MIIIYIWFYALLISPIVIITYCTFKNKTMTWRDFAWWIYGVIFGAFPFYVAVMQHMKL
jgi:hypothetical protein